MSDLVARLDRARRSVTEWGVEFQDGEVWSADKGAAVWLSERHDERPTLVSRSSGGEWEVASDE